MATGSGNGVFYSAQAAESLAGAQYKVGKLNSTGQLAIAVAKTTGIGIIQDDAVLGQECKIQLHGISKAVAAASVTVDSFVGANSTGQVAIVSSANDRIIGQALTPSTNAGDIITIMIGGVSNL